MASTSRCEYCGGTVSSTDEHCPNCGAPNPGYVADTERHVFLPKTIEELKEYCAERGMPLLKMRFFIGEDFREPRAFGIYRDGTNFIVYKNKANGQRAVRYNGPDEAYAVNELFMKLLDECHSRGIYPDGRSQEQRTAYSQPRKTGAAGCLPLTVFIVIMISVTILAAIISGIRHRNDGYYGIGDGTVYYRYGNDWYYSQDIGGSVWYETDDFPYSDYEEYSMGDEWDSDWGVSDFRESSAWDEIQESHSSSSSDYDDWDSGGTDWDSDW